MMGEMIEKNKPPVIEMSDPGPATLSEERSVRWNSRLEEAAKDIGESSKSYKLMHIEEAQQATTIYNGLMIAGIVTGPLAGIVTSVGTAIAIEGNTMVACNIVSIILGFISGIIVSVIKFGRYEEMSNANKQAAARYTSIESNVRRQLSLFRTDRVAASPYMEWLEAKYDELFLSAPLLPASAYDKFSNRAEELGLKIPNRYDSVIEINHEYEDARMGEVADQTTTSVNENPGDDMGVASSKTAISAKWQTAITDVMLSQAMKGEKKVKRTETMSQFPELNECSDQMLRYEMKRMMGFN